MSTREADQNYANIELKLNKEWRVIRCHNDMQWIVQKRGNGKVWHNKGFCRTLSGLKRVLKWERVEIPAWAKERLDALPEHYDDLIPLCDVSAAPLAPTSLPSMAGTGLSEPPLRATKLLPQRTPNS